MARTQLNLVANFVGTGWSALMQFAFVPLYVKFLGIEAYGLIGVFATLQAVLQILDFGLSPTMNRTMARYSVQPEKVDEARDFVRTLEGGYWAIGMAIGAVVIAGAPVLAGHWIRPEHIPVSVVRHAVVIMGLVTALQWPLSFYEGGLLGLQQQVLLNSLKVVMATLSGGGAVLILWLVSPKITTFFSWQIFTSGLYVALITVLLWRSLPPARRRPRIDFGLVRQVWHFAAGMSGITVSALILTQLDKVILSKVLSLEKFGYYTLAGVLASGLYMIITPVFNAIFPRFSALAARGDEEVLILAYHRGTQLMAVLVLPVAIVVMLFSQDILLLWTGSIEAARNAAPIASVLVVGTALNGLMNLPYALQLAYGWTGIGLRINTAFIITLVPATIFLATRYGAVGAATVWVALNAIYMAIGIPLTHRRLLKGEGRRWFTQDVGLPLVGAILVGWVGRGLIVGPMSPLLAAVSLSAVLIIALASTVLAADHVRLWVLSQLSRPWRVHGVRRL